MLKLSSLALGLLLSESGQGAPPAPILPLIVGYSGILMDESSTNYGTRPPFHQNSGGYVTTPGIPHRTSRASNSTLINANVADGSYQGVVPSSAHTPNTPFVFGTASPQHHAAQATATVTSWPLNAPFGMPTVQFVATEGTTSNFSPTITPQQSLSVDQSFHNGLYWSDGIWTADAAEETDEEEEEDEKNSLTASSEHYQVAVQMETPTAHPLDDEDKIDLIPHSLGVSEDLTVDGKPEPGVVHQEQIGENSTLTREEALQQLAVDIEERLARIQEEYGDYASSGFLPTGYFDEPKTLTSQEPLTPLTPMQSYAPVEVTDDDLLARPKLQLSSYNRIPKEVTIYCYPFGEEEINGKCLEGMQYLDATGVYLPMMAEIGTAKTDAYYEAIRTLKSRPRPDGSTYKVYGVAYDNPQWGLLTDVRDCFGGSIYSWHNHFCRLCLSIRSSTESC